jgi:hypothetical protein
MLVASVCAAQPVEARQIVHLKSLRSVSRDYSVVVRLPEAITIVDWTRTYDAMIPKARRQVRRPAKVLPMRPVVPSVKAKAREDVSDFERNFTW